MDNKDAETQEFLQSMLLTKNIKIENGRLLLLGRPGLLLNANVLISAFKEIIEKDPTKLFELGYKAFGVISEDYSARFSTLDKTLNFIEKVATAAGIGRIKLTLESNRVIADINPSVFAEAYINLFNTTDKPICYFSSGVLSRMVSSAIKEEIKFTEVNCVAKGDQSCKFLAEGVNS